MPLLLGLSLVALGSYVSAKKEAAEIYDAQLTHFAQALMEISLHEVSAGDTDLKLVRLKDGRPVAYKKDLSYRVWLSNKLLMQSDNALASRERAPATGFFDLKIASHQLREFVLREGELQVEVAEDYHVRTQLLHHVALSIVLPYLLMIPLLIAAILWGLRAGLQPLDTISRTVASLRPDKLERVALHVAVPRELEPFVDSINQLMQRVEEVIEREKQFTGYAAHELRTPLAALKTHLQVALREKSPSVQREMFAEAVAITDRLAHLVNQLLLLLRSQKTQQVLEPLDISQLVLQSASDIGKVVHDKDQHLALSVQPDIIFEGNPDMLRVMLRNLLDNASRYSPPGATITLKLTRPEASGLHLSIHNTDSSLSPEDLPHIFEPFYRGKANLASGVGLGLAIVHWIALIHHLKVSALNENGGFAIHFSQESPK